MRKDADVLDALLSQYRSDPTARAALSKRGGPAAPRGGVGARGAGGARHENRNSLLARLQLEHGAAPAPAPSRPTKRPRRRLASVVAEEEPPEASSAPASTAATPRWRPSPSPRRRPIVADVLPPPPGGSAWAEEVIARARGHLGRDPDAQLNALVRARRKDLELAGPFHFNSDAGLSARLAAAAEAASEPRELASPRRTIEPSPRGRWIGGDFAPGASAAPPRAPRCAPAPGRSSTRRSARAGDRGARARPPQGDEPGAAPNVVATTAARAARRRPRRRGGARVRAWRRRRHRRRRDDGGADDAVGGRRR